MKYLFRTQTQAVELKFLQIIQLKISIPSPYYNLIV